MAATQSRAKTSDALSTWQKDFDSRPNPAANDFRSDTITMPSGAMLGSILTSAVTLGDDVFSEDGPTNDLEKYIAELTGLPHAVFVLSGTMGNQVAIRSLLKQPPYSLICDRRSHLFEFECGMASMFSQVQIIPVTSQNNQYLTVDDIAANVVPDDGDTHCAPTRFISLENTSRGKIMPLDELKSISTYAKAHGLLLHMDGARLWNACYPPLPKGKTLSPAEAAGAAKLILKEYCALADTVTMCFSKSLGGPGGAILLSRSAEVISRARHFRKALGGGMRQVGVLSAPARVAVDSVFLSGDLIPRSSAIARRLEESWLALGGQIKPGLEQETNMVWLDLKAANVTDAEFVAIAEQEQVKVFDGRLVTHYQIKTPFIEALEQAFKRTLELGRNRKPSPIASHKSGTHSYKKG